MKYCFNVSEKSICERILEINNLTLDKLDVSDFTVDYNLDILINFKEKLLALKDKRFLIVGDYDCDGICATTIISKLLSDLNIKANYYIPSRIKEGYGLSETIVQKAIDNHFDCLFCVDNGVVASKELDLCKQHGIKVFIIDHHEYVDLPDCEALLHPNLFTEKYSDMCAGALSCLLANSFKYDELSTCLGGLATLADMVSVFNYNRYLLKKTIEIIKQGHIYPLNLLLGDNEVTYENLQYNVIPKINAVSRLDDLMNVNYIVRFLLANDEQCLNYYDKIEIINKARKDYTKQMSELALNLVDCNNNIILIAHDNFKEGLCGLVANKILAQFNKPVIVFAKVGNTLKGSGRAPLSCNLYAYLCACKELFTSFGGHQSAVGLSMELDKFESFKEYVNNTKLEYSEESKDVLVLNKKQINKELIQDINSLAPYGIDFKEPILALNNDYETKFVVANKYPKFKINDLISAISFNTNLLDKDFEYMIGKIKNDDYNRGKLSFIIEDLV